MKIHENTKRIAVKFTTSPFTIYSCMRTGYVLILLPTKNLGIKEITQGLDTAEGSRDIATHMVRTYC